MEQAEQEVKNLSQKLIEMDQIQDDSMEWAMYYNSCEKDSNAPSSASNQ